MSEFSENVHFFFRFLLLAMGVVTAACSRSASRPPTNEEARAQEISCWKTEAILGGSNVLDWKNSDRCIEVGRKFFLIGKKIAASAQAENLSHWGPFVVQLIEKSTVTGKLRFSVRNLGIRYGENDVQYPDWITEVENPIFSDGSQDWQAILTEDAPFVANSFSERLFGVTISPNGSPSVPAFHRALYAGSENSESSHFQHCLTLGVSKLNSAGLSLFAFSPSERTPLPIGSYLIKLGEERNFFVVTEIQLDASRKRILNVPRLFYIRPENFQSFHDQTAQRLGIRLQSLATTYVTHSPPQQKPRWKDQTIEEWLEYLESRNFNLEETIQALPVVLRSQFQVKRRPLTKDATLGSSEGSDPNFAKNWSDAIQSTIWDDPDIESVGLTYSEDEWGCRKPFIRGLPLPSEGGAPDQEQYSSSDLVTYLDIANTEYRGCVRSHQVQPANE